MSKKNLEATMNLETSRLIIRDFTENDLDDFYEIFSDADVMENCEPPYSRENMYKLRGEIV